MKAIYILMIMMSCDFKNGSNYGIHGVESSFSRVGHLWNEPAEGSESGGYLTGKYRNHIEGAIDRLIAKTEINHNVSNNQYM